MRVLTHTPMCDLLITLRRETGMTNDTNRQSTSASRYTHRIVLRGSLCSQHTGKALAEKARGRLVAMSNGKLTTADFQIEEIAR
jgi:hypothetical protein